MGIGNFFENLFSKAKHISGKAEDTIDYTSIEASAIQL
jgi:hypothetical protein|tara:strand:- start:17351 stop:17464 length:114 start_codon:yes stop_codon:yes gene_type:complete